MYRITCTVITRKLWNKKTTLSHYWTLIKSNIEQNGSVYTAQLLCPMLIGLFKVITWVFLFQSFLDITLSYKIIENRIYNRGEFTRKKCKTAILLYCFHTAGVLHIFMLYNLWALEYHFIQNLKLLLKENQIMK